jgi:hypothetical protein
MGYYEYRFLPDDERERMYQKWCQKNQLDPDADGSGDAFIASLDAKFAEGISLTKPEIIGIIRSIRPGTPNLESHSRADLLTIYNQAVTEALREDTDAV